MSDDWTVDIALRTPSERQASKGQVTTSGTVLRRPAVLVTHGSEIRLKVSGFCSRDQAEVACPRLCFALRYMSLQIPIAVEFNPTPQKVYFSPNPREAAANISKSFGGADFGDEVHGIMDTGAPGNLSNGQQDSDDVRR